MARNAPQPTLVDARTGVIIEDGEISGDKDDQEQSFQEWVDALGAEKNGYTMRAYRLPLNEKGHVVVNAKQHQMVHLDSWPLDAMGYDDLFATLKSHYMPLDKPGTVMPVRLMIFKNGGRLEKNVIITVMKPANTQENPQAKDNSIIDMLKAMQENTNAQLASFQQALMQGQQMARPAIPAQDPFEMSLKMMTAMGGLMAGVMGRSAGGGIKETLDLLATAKSLFGGEGGNNNPDGDSPAAILSAAAPFASSLVELVKANPHQPAQQALPAPAPVFQQPAQSQPAQVAPAPAGVQRVPTLDEQRAKYGLGTIAAATAAPNAVPPPVPGGNPMFQYLPFLCNFAASNVPPEQAALTALDQVPEEMDSKVWEFVSDPQCIEKMIQGEPRVAQYRDWFEKFRAAIIKEFSDPEPGEIQPEQK